MRTTLTLDDDVAASLRAEAHQSRRPFQDEVNECLRRGIAQRDRARTVARFDVKPRDMGALQPGMSFDKIADLLARIAGPDRA